MNEKLKKYKDRAGVFDNPDQEGLDLFAELIVKECMNTIDPKTGNKWIKDQSQEEFWRNHSVHLIEKHFGVEE